jgi:cytochrome-b5 reductase
MTPFYQLLHHVLLSSNAPGGTGTRFPRFTLLHGARTPADLPPAEILGPLREYAFAHPDNLRMRYFVDEDTSANGEIHTAANGLPLSVGRVDLSSIRDAFSATSASSERTPPSSWWTQLFRSSTQTRPAQLSAAEVERRKRTLVVVCGPEPLRAFSPLLSLTTRWTHTS